MKFPNTQESNSEQDHNVLKHNKIEHLTQENANDKAKWHKAPKIDQTQKLDDQVKIQKNPTQAEFREGQKFLNCSAKRTEPDFERNPGKSGRGEKSRIGTKTRTTTRNRSSKEVRENPN